MGLVFVNNSPEDAEPKRSAPLPIDKTRAQRLHEGIAARGLSTVKNLRTSATGFATIRRVLEKQVGSDRAAKRLDAALDWLLEYLKRGGKMGMGHGTPDVKHGAAFAKKFDSLESAMTRDRERNPSVIVTDKAKAIATRVAALGFPPSVKSILAELAQTTMDRYKPHRDRLEKFARENTDAPSARAVCHLSRALPGAERYAELYLTQWVHNRVSWAKWNGDTASLYWTKDHEHFHKMLADVLAKYGAGAFALTGAKGVMGV